MEGCKLLEPRESVTRGRLSGVVAWALACALALAPLPVIAEGLGLRVHDAVGPPGGRIGVVLRTYASKPIEQGEICFQARAMVPGQPAGLATYESATVFSVAGDVVLLATPRLFDDPQVLVMQFESVSATINSIDGPLAVMYFQLDESVQPGQVYELTVDLQNTFLVDENGIPIAISPRPGALEVRAPDGPIRFAAHAENVGVGGLARTSVTTFEPIRLSAGQAGFRYDPTIVDGPPTVIMDPRHGQAAFVADVSTPGLVLVSFTSPDGSLNEVPGDVIEIRLPISPSAPPGTTYPVTSPTWRATSSNWTGTPIAATARSMRSIAAIWFLATIRWRPSRASVPSPARRRRFPQAPERRTSSSSCPTSTGLKENTASIPRARGDRQPSSRASHKMPSTTAFPEVPGPLRPHGARSRLDRCLVRSRLARRRAFAASGRPAGRSARGLPGGGSGGVHRHRVGRVGDEQRLPDPDEHRRVRGGPRRMRSIAAPPT
jgi:hypothetical protein